MEMEKERTVPTIAEAAGTCLGSFKQCLGQGKGLDSREHSLLEDQLGRFSIWASNIGAFAPRRASLDHRLRMAPDVQRLVRGLLQTLNDHIQADLSQISSQESIAREIDLRPISRDLSLLHRLSNTIRKASRESQNLRAAASFKITDEGGNDVGLEFRDLFAYQMICIKFPKCNDALKERLASAMLLRRKRILYRRSRYGRLVDKHTAPDESITEQPAQPENIKGKSGQSEAGSRATTTATTVTPEQFKKASAPSVVAKPKTIRLSGQEEALFPPAPKVPVLQKLKVFKEECEARRKIHLETIEHHDLYIQSNGQSPVGQDELDQLKKNTEDSEDDFKKNIEMETKVYLESVEVVCPYCCCTLSGADVMSDHKWRNHVKHDLDAYVCLVENCSKGDTLYSHSEEWLKHMREHKIRWRCTARAHGVIVFKDQEEYLDHIRAKHKGTESQLNFLADSSSRSSGPLFGFCPLCGISEVNIPLENHVAGHLRYLAIKSLPYVDEHDQHQDSDGSVHSGACGIGSRSTIEEDSEYGLPLNFDDNPQVEQEFGVGDGGEVPASQGTVSGDESKATTPSVEERIPLEQETFKTENNYLEILDQCDDTPAEMEEPEKEEQIVEPTEETHASNNDFTAEHTDPNESIDALPMTNFRDEDYYRMPPPPLKKKPSPQIIQKQRPEAHKPMTTGPFVLKRRQSKSSFGMSDLDAALDQGYRRSSGETIIPERSRHLRNPRRPTVYREASRPSRIALESSNSLRRNPTVYYNDELQNEDRSREAEEYQASRSAEIHTERREDRFTREQDGPLPSGSVVDSAKPEDEDKNDGHIVMTMNGVTMSIGRESIISQAGDTGAVELSIQGKRPRRYITRSASTDGTGRRGQVTGLQQDREGRRSERSSRTDRFLD